MSSLNASSWPNAQRILEILHSLSFRTTDLSYYLMLTRLTGLQPKKQYAQTIEKFL
ncbi:MAG: hypothetical protein H7Y37_07575 [Anaerolineae bacterium]|nr:hypothetical protein [Gloeobacterales cyanobacterium ES-bin-313]